MYDTAAYIANLGGEVSAVTVEADTQIGAGYYRQYCSACHGPAAEGNLALHSRDWRVRTTGTCCHSYRHFAVGFAAARPGTKPASRCGHGRVLPDDEAVASVVAYIRSLAQ